MRNNKFEDNIASSSGGAIMWSDIEPINIENQDFVNNSAGLYGDNYASFPQKVIEISEFQFKKS